ncbi:hypothetical protein L208DRAFT_1403370 [Tricholoma matsutake]|nr:hypothetical protein L208DRAFT_1403370 [Tricholoma matsutake 945]
MGLQLAAIQRNPVVSFLGTYDMKIRMEIGFSFAVITVTIISVTMAKVLSTAHTSIKRTNTILQQLLFFIVTRYLLVVLNSIALMVAFGMVGSTLDWFPSILFVSKLHVISMVAL